MSLGPVRAIQHGLESLYRIETHLDIHDFLLDRDERERLAPAHGRRPREQLLLREDEGGLDVALYLEDEAVHALHRHDPRHGVDERNLESLLLVLEGVSHFIYTVHRARSRRSVSALELELQAEVDKYVSLVLLCWQQAGEAGGPARRALIARLFEQVIFHGDLSHAERERYTTANAAARSYARALERRYLRSGSLPAFLAEVRRFWRLSLGDKLSHISQSAA